MVMVDVMADAMQMHGAGLTPAPGHRHGQFVIFFCGLGPQGFGRNEGNLARTARRSLMQKQTRQVGGWPEQVENRSIDFDFRFPPDFDLCMGQARARHANGHHHRQSPIPLPFSAHRLPRQRFGVFMAPQ
jgi:hypothetical protein